MAAVATETEQPASACVCLSGSFGKLVGNAIVQQYYHIQHQSPELVHRFYQDMSKLGRPDGNGTMIITTTMQVMDMKESAVPLSSPAPPAPRRSVTKSQGQQVNLAQASASAAEPPLSGSNAIENGNNQEGEADGYSIYIKGLPLNATLALLENEFKRFGPTKTVFKLRVTNSRDFVLALWNLRWQVLCKQQLRLHILQLMDTKWLWRKRGLLILE